MTPELTRFGQLPIVLPPAADELLSSWIHRHAIFYGVPPLAMLRHCLIDVASLRAIDLLAAPGATAGVSIVERRGPAMLAWLESKTIGQNRSRFNTLAAHMLGVPIQPEATLLFAA